MTIIMYCRYCHCCQQLLFVLLVITCVQGVYNYVPQTGHISTVCSCAAVLYSQFMVHVMMVVMLLLLLLLQMLLV